MNSPYHEIDIAYLSELAGDLDYTGISNDFFIRKINGGETTGMLRYPMRLSGYAIIYCTRGHCDIDINVRKFHISRNMMLFYAPGSTVRLRQSDAPDDCEIVLVAASRKFVQGLPINFKGIYEKGVKLMNNPCMTFDDSGRKLLTDYYTLVSDLCTMNLRGADNAIRSIGASLLSLLGNLWDNELETNAIHRVTQSRTQATYEEFLTLVAENFATQKSVVFYAEKLYLTPKYLTTLVKNISGRTATEWIDSFVILEAKNLLKYSNLSVKEIGFRLNFRSIPSFHKFFKKNTGMTPSEYRDA